MFTSDIIEDCIYGAYCTSGQYDLPGISSFVKNQNSNQNVSSILYYFQLVYRSSSQYEKFYLMNKY